MLRSTSAADPSRVLEFRAGTLSRSGTTVTADERKGLVFLTKNDDEPLHFFWADRNTNTVQEELILFPGDAEWVPVKQCKDGRVFVLKFLESDVRHFFWMQEPDTEKDKTIAKKMNNYLGASGDDDDEDKDVSMAAGDEEPAADTAAAGSSSDSALSSAAQQLAGIFTEAQKHQDRLKDEQGIDLAQVLTTDTMISLIDDAEHRDGLLAAMPEGQERTVDAFKALVRSPQFSEALRGFQAGLQSGQLAPVINQFGVNTDPQALGSVQAFADALEKQAKEGDDKDTEMKDD